jgi:hypothetical protein
MNLIQQGRDALDLVQNNWLVCRQVAQFQSQQSWVRQ